MKDPVRCCIYMLRPTKTFPSLYLKREMAGTPFSFVPLHLASSFPIWCFEKNLWIQSSRGYLVRVVLCYNGHGINLLCEWILTIPCSETECIPNFFIAGRIEDAQIRRNRCTSYRRGTAILLNNFDILHNVFIKEVIVLLQLDVVMPAMVFLM